jgi:hypothetical protein
MIMSNILNLVGKETFNRIHIKIKIDTMRILQLVLKIVIRILKGDSHQTQLKCSAIKLNLESLQSLITDL